MCRIAGLVSNRIHTEELKNKVSAMCNVMQHGGPDDDGIFTDLRANLAFGHRRLSIIDLSRNGHQPMADVAQKVWITFNGEIYNYQELKTELLALGSAFVSDTDTEVIIQAYLHWGTASFAKLKGIFAFALYDTVKHLTYLTRDTAGIKPLYYMAQNGFLCFASETRAFKAAGIAVETDERWPVWLLAFGNIPEPYTTLKNVLSLPRGHYLCRENDGTFNITNYQDHTQEGVISNPAEAQEGIFTYLSNAVSRQLIADAPIGVFLSGGIDSSIITLLADQQKQQQLKTISIFFDEQQYDERSYQQTVTDKLNGQCFKHLVKQQDFDRYLPDIIDAMDIPTTDGINTWFISKYAHDAGLKAVLSGVGADELLGGYPSFQRIKYLKLLHKLPASVFKASTFFNSDSYKRLTYLQYDNPVADYLFLRGLYIPEDIARILNMDEKQVADILLNSITPPHLNAYDKLHAAWFEYNLYMQNQLLRDTDVMSMSHGLEVRVPFLDEDFQRFVNRIDPNIRFNNTTPKKLLVDSFSSLLPQTVWDRPKMGFSFPLQEWMRNNQNISNPGFYKNEASKKLIKKFKNGRIHWSRAFALHHVQQHV
jgi:asparagine synthase (glutamine-hydrolysing)